MSLLDTVEIWIDKNRGRWLHDLKNWLSIPSISAQPEHDTDTVAAAEWAADYLRTKKEKLGHLLELKRT